MTITLPRLNSTAVLILGAEDRFSDDDYFQFCMDNPELFLERTAKGEILIMPPIGPDASALGTEVLSELVGWAKKDGRGQACGPSAHFLLPDGSAMSADAGWISKQRRHSVSREEWRRFPHFAPEFVVEVTSLRHEPDEADCRMRRWIANGVERAWLIDGENRRVFVYRGPGQPEVVDGADLIEGDGPVAGFVLPLDEIRQRAL
jgi:Uma2 family endonuclease